MLKPVEKSTVVDGMIIDKNVAIPTRDGHILRCDVYRPSTGPAVPALLSVSPYGKDMPMDQADPFEYRLCAERGPYMVYERFHAPTWVADGYALVHIDIAGTGASPGVIDPWSTRDVDHYEDAINFIAEMDWCTGKVGLAGLSYHSMTQPAVAVRKPAALTCLLMWEVGHDFYRHGVHDGGVYNANFTDWWWRIWVLRAQYGVGTLSEDELAANRVDFESLMREHTLMDAFWEERIADVSQIDVPFLTVANWCGRPVSLGSHFEMFERAASEHKWLRVITGKHVKPMYDQDSRRVQKRFLDYWLKGIDNGLLDTPRVEYVVRHRDGNTQWASDNTWPLSNTQFTDLYLDASDHSLKWEPPTRDAQTSYHGEADDAMWLPAGTYDTYLENLSQETKRDGSSVTFTSKPFEESTEITGPINLRLSLSVDGTDDTDVFVTVRYLCSDGYEVLFDGILDSPNVATTSGVLRASHRKLDQERSTRELPHHLHKAEELLTAGEVYQLQIAVGPTSVVIEKGGRIAIEVGSRDGVNTFCYLHNDPGTRKMGGTITIHTGPGNSSSGLLPLQSAGR